MPRGHAALAADGRAAACKGKAADEGVQHTHSGMAQPGALLANLSFLTPSARHRSAVAAAGGHMSPQTAASVCIARVMPHSLVDMLGGHSHAEGGNGTPQPVQSASPTHLLGSEPGPATDDASGGSAAGSINSLALRQANLMLDLRATLARRSQVLLDGTRTDEVRLSGRQPRYARPHTRTDNLASGCRILER